MKVILGFVVLDLGRFMILFVIIWVVVLVLVSFFEGMNKNCWYNWYLGLENM